MRLLPSGGKPFHQERRKQMIFRKRKQTLSPAGAASVPQTAPQQPYGELMRYTPLAPLEGRLYEMLREAVPIIDAAIVNWGIHRLLYGWAGTEAAGGILDERSRWRLPKRNSGVSGYLF